MQTPKPLSGNFSYNNVAQVIVPTGFLIALAILAFWMHFSNSRNFIPIFIGISLLFLAWEVFIASNLKINYCDGIIRAEKAKLKYSFLFGRSTRILEISPDNFDQIWIGRTRKGTYQILFVKDNQAYSCILWEGTALFPNQLIRCFPNRVFQKDKSYHQTIKNLKRAFPSKVI